MNLLQTGWQNKPLSEVAKIDRISVGPEAIEDGSTYVGLENITRDGSFDKVEQVLNGQLASNKFVFSDKHVLYGKLRPYLSKIARPNFSGICSTDILPILPSKEVDRDFLYHFLRHPEMIQFATTRSTGANLPRLSPSELAKFSIPLPSIGEQKRIAGILDQAEAIYRRRQEPIRVARNLQDAYFAQCFGGDVQPTKRWPTEKLSEVTTRITNGYVGPTRDIYRSKGVPYLLAKYVKNSVLNFDDTSFVSDEFNHKHQKSKLKADDVLLVQSGVFSGDCAVVPDKHEGHNCHALIILSSRKDKLNGDFLARWIVSTEGKEAMRKRFTGATIPHLNCKDVRKIDVPIPPIENQKAFADFIRSSNKIVKTYESMAQESETLFQAITHRAFEGEL